MFQMRAPFGRTVFDAKGLNTAALQVVSSDSTVMKAPLDLQTAAFVYPMPTWDERQYHWRLIRDGSEIAAMAIAVCCTVLLIAIIITACYHYKGTYNASMLLYILLLLVLTKRFSDKDIRILHHLHVASLCVAAVVVCWGLAFLWQADVTQTQCDLHLWFTVLPASYAVHLVNMKAYRLSVIVTANFRRLKPFSHDKVLAYTCAWTFATAIILMISAVLDPPKRICIQNDVYRRSLDRYQCSSGHVTPALLWILVCGHIVASVVCVVSVRNGMEAFKDGMLMKESFVLLYSCLLVAFILGQLNLSLSTNYVLRSAFLSFGITLFCFRLMIDRCMKYWLPEYMHRTMRLLYMRYFNRMLSRESQTSIFLRSAIVKVTADSSRSLKVRQDEDSPLYADEVPTEGNVADIKAVLMDPVRSTLLLNVAISVGWGDVAELVSHMIKYEKYSSEMLQHSLVLHGNAARVKAIDDRLKNAVIALSKILTVVKVEIDGYGKRNSKTSSDTDNDMNIPSKTKAKIERCADEWSDDISFASAEWIQDSLKSDYARRMELIEPALNDLCVLLYQKIWNAFRISETEMIAGEDPEYVVRLAENI